jgi:hypothetical protein
VFLVYAYKNKSETFIYSNNSDLKWSPAVDILITVVRDFLHSYPKQ